jgi:endonuclease/exonuclease/phosphatase family metal-dependent hydrolase
MVHFHPKTGRMKRSSKWIFILALIFLVPAVSVLGFLVFSTLTDYRPTERETLQLRGKGTPFPLTKRSLTFMTWNIGYSGLGRKMDFFYENGTRVRPEKDEFSGYLAGIERTLAKADSADLFFLQEADVHAKRSYYTDEVGEIAKIFPSRSYVFAKNYDCRFVPLPLNDPMGRVISGISCFTRFIPSSAERIDFGTSFSWPQQLFFLKRCFIVMRFPVVQGKELVVINTHNSTFDKNGRMRMEELARLRSFMLTELSKGNYVIAGGDWNNNPPGFNPRAIRSGDRVKSIEPPIDLDFFPRWTLAYDSSSPTNRDVDMPYHKGLTRTTVIDFFVVSPNVEVNLVKTPESGFRYSDHQPVFMKITLK